MLKDILRHNGDAIVKNFKLIPFIMEDSMNFISSNDSYLMLNSRSSSFSQAQEECFKEKIYLSFIKSEMENDAKAKFLKEIQVFKEKLGIKNQKKSKILGRKATKSFTSKPFIGQTCAFEVKKDFMSKKDFEDLENKLKSFVVICKKDEKDFNKFAISFWELLASNPKFLKTLSIILEDSIKSQEALVNFNREIN